MKQLSAVLLSSTVIAVFGLSQLGFTQQGYNNNQTMSMETFKGTTLYQSDMSLEDASTLASVTAEQALTLVQQTTGNIPEGTSAELTLLNGYLVWSVDVGSEEVFVDITNPELIVKQQPEAKQYAAGEDEEYKDDNEYKSDYKDDDEYESDYEEDDGDEYGSESDSEYNSETHSEEDSEMDADHDPEGDSEIDADNEMNEEDHDDDETEVKEAGQDKV